MLSLPFISSKKYIFLLCCTVFIIACRKEQQATVYDPFLDEPPANPYLANSPWSSTHRNCYAQASSPYPGPSFLSTTNRKDFKNSTPGLITMVISGVYPDGNRVLWGGNASHVAKLMDTDTGLTIIAMKDKEGATLSSLFSLESGTSGAYTLIDKDNIFYSPRGTSIYAYGDAETGNPFSGIELLRTFTIPANLTAANERIVGTTMTFDGYIAFATSLGLVGVVSRDFSEVHTYKFNNEEVSNSIACDNDNGIYVVTSAKMYRVQWTGARLSINENDGGWASVYETGSAASGIRLGVGSGSTPTVMGFGAQDRFIVITDGQDLMHLVLFWRDKIPNDWQQLPGTRSRRIAAQVPVRFGNPSATKSLSEQSVCVRGYGALVVNNELKNSSDNKTANILLSGIPQNAPYGAEKFEWNPVRRALESVWVNKTVSLPSGIPCMSAATNMAYCMGQKNGVWNFTAMNWSTGQTVFEYPLGDDLKYNSAYAATQIGLNSGLYSGTLFGFAGMWQK